MDWVTRVYNYHTAADYLPMFLEGAWATLWIAFVCLLLSLPLGTLLALMRMSPRGWLWRPVAAYTQFIRATPLLVQIFVIYHAIPLLSPDPQLIGDTASGIIALTIHTTPYMAEIIRGGILSVGRGQTEAAIAVGMTRSRTMVHVILPQAFANIAPPLLGQMAVLVKDTSLLSTIAVFEVVSAGTTLMSERIAPNESFITITVCYLLIYVLLLHATNWVRRRVGGAAWAGR
jgi:polar amino acid transport system permease protein